LPLFLHRSKLETKATLKQCILARSALSALNQAANLLPNPAMLINTIPILEARASSEIENIVTTADKLFAHLQAEGTADPATKEALRYRDALLENYGDAKVRPLHVGMAEAICSRIKGKPMRVRRGAGLSIANRSTGAIIYTPPHDHARIKKLLTNWQRFLQGTDELDPLIRMAVGHYQFEAIHPFTDGNGRTGRVLNSLFLVQQGLLDLPILYLSRYIIANKRAYYRLLLDVTRMNARGAKQAWEDWIVFVLRGIEETALWTIAKIELIRGLVGETVALVRARLPKIYSRELVDVIFEQPYCRISNLVQRGVGARQAASRYLKALTEIGVLSEQTLGREKLFVHQRLLAVLADES
jgi:Fic family protein